MDVLDSTGSADEAGGSVEIGGADASEGGVDPVVNGGVEPVVVAPLSAVAGGGAVTSGSDDELPVHAAAATTRTVRTIECFFTSRWLLDQSPNSLQSVQQRFRPSGMEQKGEVRDG